MKHAYILTEDMLTLRPLAREDIDSLRVWRNDPNNNRFLQSRGIITQEMQEAWFNRYLTSPEQIIFAIVEACNGKLLGSVSLYDFTDDGTVAEFGGIMLGEPSARGRGFGKLSTLLCARIGFEQLHLTRLHATVNTQNIAAICAYTHVGYEVKGIQALSDGTPGEEFRIELSRNRFEKLWK